MATIAKSQSQVRTAEKAEKKTNVKAQSEIWERAEEARFGIIPLALTVVACLGGFAVTFGAAYAIVPFVLIVFSTMAVLTLMLAVAPMKAIIYASILATVIDIVVLVSALFS